VALEQQAPGTGLVRIQALDAAGNGGDAIDASAGVVVEVR
jgi:hypothetical protein